MDDEVKQLPQQATLLGTLVGLYKYQTGNLNFWSSLNLFIYSMQMSILHIPLSSKQQFVGVKSFYLVVNGTLWHYGLIFIVFPTNFEA